MWDARCKPETKQHFLEPNIQVSSETYRAKLMHTIKTYFVGERVGWVILLSVILLDKVANGKSYTLWRQCSHDFHQESSLCFLFAACRRMKHLTYSIALQALYGWNINQSHKLFFFPPWSIYLMLHTATTSMLSLHFPPQPCTLMSKRASKIAQR